MDLHYLLFLVRNLANRTKPMQVRILNSANLISKNIVNSIGIFNESASINNTFKE